jgi:type I restriction enzyme S subunit
MRLSKDWGLLDMSFSEWKEVSFEEIMSIPLRNGLSKPKAIRGKGTKMVNMGEIFGFDRIYDEINMDKVPTTEKEYTNTKLEKGDLLFARQSLVWEGAGKCVIIMEAKEDLVYESHIIRVRLNKNKVDPEYYYYYFISSVGRNRVMSIAEQVAAAGIRGSDLKRLKVPMPELNEQKAIADTLSCLDDKIELNNRINKNLEEMAQAIFKSWFVDFEPFQDGEFEDGELGRIPKGWRVCELGEVLAELETGNRPKGGVGNIETGIPSIGAENIIGLGQYDFMKEKFVSKEYFDKMKKGIVKNWDVLLYKDGAQLGRKTMFAQNFPHKNCCVNSHVFILRSNLLVSQTYLYFWLDQDYMTQNLINLNTNSAQPGINQTSLKKLKIIIPDVNTIKRFSDLISPKITLLFEKCKENKELVKTRDVLLPKLMSGEIRVPIGEIQ